MGLALRPEATALYIMNGRDVIPTHYASHNVYKL